MIKYISGDFEDKVKQCTSFIKQEFEDKEHFFYCDEDDLISTFIINEIDNSDDNENIINESTQICVCLGRASRKNEVFIDMTLSELFILIDLYRNSTIDSGKSISNDMSFHMVKPLETYYIEELFDNTYNTMCNDAFILKTNFHDKEVTCSLVKGITPISLKAYKNDEYDEFFPPVSNEDYFVKIKSSCLEKQEHIEIANAYIFELSASKTTELSLTEKVKIDFDFEEEIEKSTENMRPLLFGKGMNELLLLYNESIATFDLDLKILRLTKVLEYVSQTVVNLEKNSIIQNKLNSLKIFRADANYINELGELYHELSQNYDTDSGAIRALINKQVDIQEIIDLSPPYLKLHKTAENLSKPKSNKKDIVNAALDNVSQSISDTRNQLAHAKSNYDLKGKECPQNEKPQFIDMLNIINQCSSLV